jgi:hypothetical protein
VHLQPCEITADPVPVFITIGDPALTVRAVEITLSPLNALDGTVTFIPGSVTVPANE